MGGAINSPYVKVIGTLDQKKITLVVDDEKGEEYEMYISKATITLDAHSIPTLVLETPHFTSIVEGFTE